MNLAQALILAISTAGAVLSYLNLRATKRLVEMYERDRKPVTYSFTVGEEATAEQVRAAVAASERRAAPLKNDPEGTC